MTYWPEFLLLFTANFINLVSPGAGVTITSRNAFLYGRESGLLTAFGIVASSIIHKAYSLLGFSWVLNMYPSLFSVVKYLGSFYLIYLGINCFINGRSIRYEKPDKSEKKEIVKKHKHISKWKAFRIGFITDLLNPMASIVFLSIVSSTISPSTPTSMLLLYMFLLICSSICWYSTLAIFFSNSKLNIWLDRHKTIIEYLNGSTLIFLGLRIIL